MERTPGAPRKKVKVSFELHVLVRQHGPFYIAQGVEVDYEAHGVSLLEVQQAFEDGFVATANEHLKLFKTLDHFFKPASDEIQKAYHSLKDRQRLNIADSFLPSTSGQVPVAFLDAN